MSEENKKFELNEEEIEKVVGGSLANKNANKKILALIKKKKEDLRKAQEIGDAELVAHLQAQINEYQQILSKLLKQWKAKSLKMTIVKNVFYEREYFIVVECPTIIHVTSYDKPV